MYYSVSNTNIILFGADGEQRNVPKGHPFFEQIKEALKDESWRDREAELFRLASVSQVLDDRFSNLSERVSVQNKTIFFDGDPVNSSLADHILRMLQEGDEAWRGLVNFMEKIASNPSEESRKSLYSWLNGRDFTILRDGNFLAYKGIKVNTEGEFLSIRSGYGIIDGVPMNGYLPNKIGSVLSVPRSYVNADINVACSHGLHAGTYAYALEYSETNARHNGYKTALVLVSINPRDVVSVPSDCEVQKLRVCSYQVLEVTENELEVPYYETCDATDDADTHDEVFDEDDQDQDEVLPEAAPQAPAASWQWAAPETDEPTECFLADENSQDLPQGGPVRGGFLAGVEKVISGLDQSVLSENSLDNIRKNLADKLDRVQQEIREDSEKPVGPLERFNRMFRD